MHNKKPKHGLLRKKNQRNLTFPGNLDKEKIVIDKRGLRTAETSPDQPQKSWPFQLIRGHFNEWRQPQSFGWNWNNDLQKKKLPRCRAGVKSTKRSETLGEADVLGGPFDTNPEINTWWRTRASLPAERFIPSTVDPPKKTTTEEPSVSLPGWPPLSCDDDQIGRVHTEFRARGRSWWSFSYSHPLDWSTGTPRRPLEPVQTTKPADLYGGGFIMRRPPATTTTTTTRKRDRSRDGSAAARLGFGSSFFFSPLRKNTSRRSALL